MMPTFDVETITSDTRAGIGRVSAFESPTSHRLPRLIPELTGSPCRLQTVGTEWARMGCSTLQSCGACLKRDNIRVLSASVLEKKHCAGTPSVLVPIHTFPVIIGVATSRCVHQSAIMTCNRGRRHRFCCPWRRHALITSTQVRWGKTIDRRRIWRL